MKVNEDKKVVLDEADVDKLLLHRLEQIQAFLENNAEEIKAKRKTAADIILFPNGQKEADIRKLMTDMLIDYLKGLIDKNKANITLRTVYSQLKNKEIELGLAGEDDKYDWLKSFSTHINQLDHYAKKAIETERDEKTYTPRSAKVVSLLRTYDAMKTDERIHKSMSATHWEKFFKRYAAMKKHLKDSTQRCLYDNYLGVKLAFSLIDKEYVEDVTRQDCRTLCEKIYRVPRRWHQELTENKTVLDILRSDSNSQTLSKQTIKKHLGTFKEFMRYAVKEEIIPNSLNEFIDMPIKSDRKERKPFTNNELKKIFNPKNYPNPHLRNNQAKFWIPLIALYHGCRSNEICQLDVADIVREKNIPCISINNDGKDKSVKNRGSKRIIPIHPRILKMGFLYYVEYQRKNKQKKLFSELTYRKETGYAAIIQHWFARYLDSIDIKSPSSVFHSFRHTFETKAVEQRIPAEYQNAICGWTDQGIGQRLYAHKKDIRIMLEEISKINYPINSELKELQKSFMDSFVIRQLGAKE